MPSGSVHPLWETLSFEWACLIVFVLFAFGYPPLCWLLWKQMSPVPLTAAWGAMIADFRRTPGSAWGWVLVEHLPTVVRLCLGGTFWGTIPAGFVTLGQICGGVEALRILVDAVFRLIHRFVPPPSPARP